MPLNWSIKDIKKYQNNIEDAYVKTRADGSDEEYFDVNPRLKTFIFWGGAVGFGSITKTNAAEYYARSKVYEKYNKTPFMQRWNNNEIEDHYLTMEMVEETIGLSTNHGTSSTTEWVKRINKWLKEVSSPGVSVLKAEIVINKHEYEQWQNKKELELEGEQNDKD